MKKLSKVFALMVLMVTGFAVQAMAVLDAAETAVFTDITTKVTDLKPAALALLGVILVAMIGLKLLKKFAHKAT